MSGLEREIPAPWIRYTVQERTRWTDQLWHDGSWLSCSQWIYLHNISCLPSLSSCDCGNENCGTGQSQGHWRPEAGICCKLSDSVRSNSDWWKIRKTDCMGWWTAVLQINLSISDPAELTIVSTEPTSILVVTLPPSRMLVRCQLRGSQKRKVCGLEPDTQRMKQWFHAGFSL